MNEIRKNIKKVWCSPGFKRYFVNTGWLFFEKISKMVITLFVGVYVARYLGPSNYGLLSYAISWVVLFSAIATLGLDKIVIRDLVRDEKKRDELLGTTFFLKITGSILLLGILAVAVRFTTNDNFTNLLIFVIALTTIFQSFNVINFYFQSRVLSKYVVYARMVSGISSAIIKLLLIYFKMGLMYFAAVMVVESVILAIGLIITYTKQKLNISIRRPKFNLAKRLLRDSWPLMLSGIAISIYMRIDQVMIKEMLDTRAVGNYAVAVKLSEVWYFIPMAITGSLFPAIINAKKISEKIYYGRLQKLYDLMTWLAIGIALLATFLANDIIRLLFGAQYQDAAGVLRIYIWASIAVFFGTAWSKWILVENGQKIIVYFHIVSMAVNIVLNVLMIKQYGIVGAAWATVISYSTGQLFALLLYRRKLGLIMFLKALIPYHIIKKLRIVK